jgi:hypothetical protein
MNILLDLENVNINNVFFTESKPNMMFEGNFTKIIYCDEFFTMYGIYMNIQLNQSASSVKLQIDTTAYNALTELEINILNAYVKSRGAIKNPTVTYKLCELLKTRFVINNSVVSNDKANSLKISGIWENSKTNEIGLSFKPMIF